MLGKLRLRKIFLCFLVRVLITQSVKMIASIIYIPNLPPYIFFCSSVIHLQFQRVTCTLLEVLMLGPWYLVHCAGLLNLSRLIIVKLLNLMHSAIVNDRQKITAVTMSWPMTACGFTCRETNDLIFFVHVIKYNSMPWVLVRILKAMFCSLRTITELVKNTKMGHNLKTR